MTNKTTTALPQPSAHPTGPDRLMVAALPSTHRRIGLSCLLSDPLRVVEGQMAAELQSFRLLAPQG